METLVGLVTKAFLGFFALIVVLVVLGVLFGKRIEKKWELEAKFYDERRREIGEFDIEKFRYAKEAGDFTVKAKFKLRHESLQQTQTVEVYVDETLTMRGQVSESGRVYFSEAQLIGVPDDLLAGQICRVKVAGKTLFEEALYID